MYCGVSSETTAYGVMLLILIHSKHGTFKQQRERGVFAMLHMYISLPDHSVCEAVLLSETLTADQFRLASAVSEVMLQYHF
jgi:hypothetical protein